MYIWIYYLAVYAYCLTVALIATVFGVGAKLLGMRVWKAAVLGVFIGLLPITVDVPTYVAHFVKCELYSGVEFYAPHDELKGRPVVSWEDVLSGRSSVRADDFIYYKYTYSYESWGVSRKVREYYDKDTDALVARDVGYDREAMYYENIKTWVDGSCSPSSLDGYFFK